jgi:hypothetical protein
LTILGDVIGYGPYVRCRPDATSKLVFTSYHKCSVPIRMITYGVDGDLLDEYLRMSETSCLESMYKFCRVVIVVFVNLYLREPTVANISRMFSINEARGFRG